MKLAARPMGVRLFLWLPIIRRTSIRCTVKSGFCQDFLDFVLA